MVLGVLLVFLGLNAVGFTLVLSDDTFLGAGFFVLAFAVAVLWARHAKSR
jgi:hypothetical protein